METDLKSIIKISKANYEVLLNGGTIGGYTYDENALYLVEGEETSNIKLLQVSLNDEWKKSNRTLEGYTMYMSDSNVGIPDSTSAIKVIFPVSGTYTLYINSYAEAECDYIVALEENYEFSPETYEEHIIERFVGSEEPLTIDNFIPVTYEVNAGDFAYIVYKKDVSADNYDDRGYLAIPNDIIILPADSTSGEGVQILKTHEELDDILSTSKDGTIVSAPIENANTTPYTDMSLLISIWDNPNMKQEFLMFLETYAREGEYRVLDYQSGEIFSGIKVIDMYLMSGIDSILVYSENIGFMLILSYYNEIDIEGEYIIPEIVSYGYVEPYGVFYFNTNGEMESVSDLTHVPLFDMVIGYSKQQGVTEEEINTVMSEIVEMYNTTPEYEDVRQIMPMYYNQGFNYYIPYIKTLDTWKPVSDTLYGTENVMKSLKGWDGSKFITQGLDIPEWGGGNNIFWENAKPGFEIASYGNETIYLYKAKDLILPGIWDDIVINGTVYLMCIYSTDMNISLIQETFSIDGESTSEDLVGMYDQYENNVYSEELHFERDDESEEFENGWYDLSDSLVFPESQYGEYDLIYVDGVAFMRTIKPYNDLSDEYFDGLIEQMYEVNAPKIIIDWFTDLRDTRVFKELPTGSTKEYIWKNDNWLLNTGGGSSSIIEIAYDDLKSLRDNGGLTPGAQYRITDYECTTTQENTRSAGHQFDIIVTADDEYTLNENAKAIKHEGDTYFSAHEHPVEEAREFLTYGDVNLNAWELKYSLDNNRQRFSWADTENGKGVIYYMKDEWNNECPYDFKNIQFLRYKITDVYAYQKDEDGNWNWMPYVDGDGNPSDLIGTYGLPIDSQIFVDEEDSKWCYTFNGNTQYDMGIIEDYDYSTDILTIQPMVQQMMDISISRLNMCNDNIIKTFNQDIDNMSNAMTLNNIVFNCENTYQELQPGIGVGVCIGNTFGVECYSITFGANNGGNKFGLQCSYLTLGHNIFYITFGNNCDSNTFGNDCYRNTFGNNCVANTFGNDCNYNTFGNDCNNNTFGNDCDSNTFGNVCYSNTFGNDCDSNTFGNNCDSNTFGNDCNNNTFGNNCDSNTFGNYCYSNTFGNDCYRNTFGNNCYYNTFGNNCDSNTFGNNCVANTFGNVCYSNTFGNNFITYSTFFEGVNNLNFSNNYNNHNIRLIHVLNGTYGIVPTGIINNANYCQMVGMTSSGNIVIKNPMD